MADPNVKNDYQSAYDAGRIGTPPITAPDGSLVVMVPHGTQRVDLPAIEKPLPRIKQQVVLHDKTSFVEYVNAFKTEHTRLFAEPGFLSGGAAHITAVFDYHTPPSAPGRSAHQAIYKPRYSDAWMRWTDACKLTMKQADFAEFVEENRKDIVNPSAAQLLDIVRTFKAAKKVEFDSLVYQSNGDVMLAYDEKTELKGKSGAIPETMKLGIPVFFRGTHLDEVPVFIRFRLSSGAVTFSLKLDRPDVIEDTAFGDIIGAVKTETGLPIHLGNAR